ncbi:hypothetical protein AVEN_203781-1 [Araneus ventricosus]|uniref:Uncharacterized protein n=1 Tax=Araneus ventricosus TaxID=182803 RepID=A0A4Y2IQ98_ARAVE|nr:hypothetical protein AVEN_203781-1 [Araneus ventricosus]
MHLQLSRFSLVILTPRFEATRGLFWDGPRHFEPRADDEDDAWAGTPRSNLPHQSMGERLATTYDLMCNRPHTRRIFSGIGFRTWNLRLQSRDVTIRPPRPHDF